MGNLASGILNVHPYVFTYSGNFIQHERPCMFENIFNTEKRVQNVQWSIFELKGV